MKKSIAIIWHIDDVKTLDDTLTDEQAMDILNFLKDNHDAEVGINWDVIESAIAHLFGDKYGTVK